MKNEETSVLQIINKFKPNELINICGISLSKVIANELKERRVKTVEELKSLVQDILEYMHAEYSEIRAIEICNQLIENAYAIYEAELLAKQEIKNHKKTTRLLNRVSYLPTVVLSREQVETKDGEVKQRWRGFTMLLSRGLLGQIQDYETNRTDVVAFSVQNNLPDIIDEETDTVVKPIIDTITWQKLENKEVMISGERVAWLKNTIAYKWLRKAFLLHIDLRAYNHSLNAPLLPGGFLANATVLLKKITTINDQHAETDGCGRIHPNHELFRQLNRPGGACTVQFRGINTKGTFAKGILVPDERCIDDKGNPTIWLDWAQIKGAQNAQAKENAKKDLAIETRLHIGILQAWDRPRKLKWSFQQLQLIQNNDITQGIIKEWINENYAVFLRGGIDSLISSIGARDEKISLMLKICMHINTVNNKFSPTQIPVIKKLLIERLQKTLYFLAQGAGKQAKQAVVAIDAGVEEGTCVIAGFKIGSEVIVHRYPTTLPQGLVKLKIVKPLPHHLINEKIVRETVFMNPKDIVDKMQGDSDGDIIGVTSDPRAITLCEHKIEQDKFYLVEPDSTKITFDNEEDGLKYVRGNPMGPVGKMCLLQAQMYAIDNLRAAIALSIPYQESVDAGKKSPKYNNFKNAYYIDNWQFTNNRYKFREFLTEDSQEMEEEVYKWTMSRLAEVGITQKNKKNVLGWRSKSKRINAVEWKTTFEKTNWDGGNLVHFAHDYALEVWKQQYQDLFDFNKPAVDISTILESLLQGNSNYSKIDIGWETYKHTVYVKSGLKKFNKALFDIMSNKNIEEESKLNIINTLVYDLDNELKKLSISEIELIWRMESTAIYQHTDEFGNNTYSDEENNKAKNNPNNAFRAVAFAGSPILDLLDIKTIKHCTFLVGSNSFKLNTIVDAALANENPYKTIINYITESEVHSAEIHDMNGNPVHISECGYCNSLLTDTLVAKIRSQKSATEYGLIRTLCTSLNQ